MSPCFTSRLASLIISLLVVVHQIAAAADDFVCQRSSENDSGTYLDLIVANAYCLDSDSLPASVFAPSELNTAGRFNANGGSPVFFHLEAGHWIFANNANINSLYVYEKPCHEEHRRHLRTTPRGLAKSSGPKMMTMKKMSKGKGKGMKKMSKGKGKGTTYKGQAKGKGMAPTKICYGAVIVDAPESYGSGFGNFIFENLSQMGVELEAMIVSHAHLDHSGNLNSLKAANPTLRTFIGTAEAAATYEKRLTHVYGNARLNEVFGSGANPDFPDYEFTDIIEDEAIFTFGNQTIEIYNGAGHTPGNMLIWHEASSSLENVDSAVFPKWAPFFEFAVAEDIPMALMLFDEYRKFPYKYFISGHLTHIGTPEDVDTSEAFIVDIVDACYRAFVAAASDPTSTANTPNILFGTVDITSPPNAGNIWLYLREWLDQVAWKCVETVLDETENFSGTKWVETLAGVRPTLFSHCRSLADTLRVETPGFGVTRR